MENTSAPNWASVKLSDLVRAEGAFCDGDWIESKDQDSAGEIRLIQLADIGDGIFKNKSDRHLTLQKAYDLKCTFLNQGDILIARMPEPLGRACIFPLKGAEKFVTVVDVAILRVDSELASNKYVCHILNSPQSRSYIDELESGTTRKRISRKNLGTLDFPLPPLAEQHRIVAKLEELFSELDKGVENLRIAQQQLKVYRQAVLQWAFAGKLTEEWRAIIGDATSNGQEFLNRITQERKTVYKNELAQHEAATANNKTKRPNKPEFYSAISDEEYSKLLELPSQWVWSKVGNLCQSIVPNRDKPKSFTGEVPWLTTPDIDSAKITVDFQSVKLGLTAEETEKYNARVIPPNSVIMTCVGSFGVVCINAKACVVNQQLHAFITHQYIYSRYLAYALKNMRNWMEQHATSTTVAYLNKTNCNSIPIPVCDINEQQQIVAEIESRLSVCDKLEETIEQSLLQAEALRQSILKQAFAGKLVPQDPSDEPAEKLLARIQAERAAANPDKIKSAKRKVK